MAQSDTQLQKVARALVVRIYAAATATSHHIQLRDAIGQIDSGMNATGNQIVTAGYGSTPLKTAMFQRMQTVAPNITGPQAAIALALWALEEAGLL